MGRRGGAVHLPSDCVQVTFSMRSSLLALFLQLGCPRDDVTTPPVQTFSGSKLVSAPIPTTSPTSPSPGPPIPRFLPRIAQSWLLGEAGHLQNEGCERYSPNFSHSVTGDPIRSRLLSS